MDAGPAARSTQIHSQPYNHTATPSTPAIAARPRGLHYVNLSASLKTITIKLPPPAERHLIRCQPRKSTGSDSAMRDVDCMADAINGSCVCESPPRWWVMTNASRRSATVPCRPLISSLACSSDTSANLSLTTSPPMPLTLYTLCHTGLTHHFYPNVTTLRSGLCCRNSVCLSVCRLSVTLVHPTQGVEAFGKISSPPCTLALLWPPCKILRKSSQGNPSVGSVKRKRGIKIERFRTYRRLYLINGTR